MNSKLFSTLLLALIGLPLLAADVAVTNTSSVSLSAWSAAADVRAETFQLGAGDTRRAGWGSYSPNERMYFPEFLPAVFERTVVLEDLPATRGLDWVFTGPRAALYLVVAATNVSLQLQYHDSPGLNAFVGKPERFPKLSGPMQVFALAGEPLRAVTVRLDHTLTLTVSLNGREVHRQLWLEGFQRHQLRLTGKSGVAQLRLQQPADVPVRVSVNPAERHQTMLGWGGITIPTAYRELSVAGRKHWWELIAEYNLLCQREYPVGGMLNRAMDNWDKLADAKAHYYGDNFPNGEISDFEYNRAIQSLGGFVMFEFWDFPAWIGESAERYAEAMVNYCQTAQRRTGQPPAIVGLQNEVKMKPSLIEPFITALRNQLDAAGFKSVKIHLANAPKVGDGLKRLSGYRDNPRVWSLINYSAANQYDFQDHFRNPDQFDATLRDWHQRTADRPFLSTELCINDNRYQSDGYALALTMGQLYHKNLTLTDAALICYCWTLLNVEQPTFGMSRSLLVTDPAAGFMPRASSHQLRVFGAFSRRVTAGMQRLSANANHPDLLVTAFADEQSNRTVVLLNRSTAPMQVTLDWPGATFTQDELTDPYHQNVVLPSANSAAATVTIPPGGVLTRSSAPLKKLPTGFQVP